MNFSKAKKLVAAVLSLSILGGCASTTMIRSSDPQAKIYVDGELKGAGSAVHSDTKIVGSSTMVQIKKEGCEPQTYMFSRNEEFDAGACVGGVLVLVPFLWIMKYKADHSYEFSCAKTK